MIDEKKLINYIKAEINPYGKPFNDTAYEFGLKLIDYIEAMEKQPQVGGWIPVSERLPEDGETVLVWFEYYRFGDYNRLFQTYGLSFTFKGKWSGLVNGETGWEDLRIIAWQPLPEPFKESEEE